MSLKLEIRLHTYQVGANTRSGTKVIFTQYLIGLEMRSELGYFAHSLISGLNDGAATLSTPKVF